MRDERDLQESFRIDTVTNRQAIVAFVQRERSRGSWPTYVGATPVIFPDYADAIPDAREGAEHRLARTGPMRLLCNRMAEEGVLVFHSHGHLGVPVPGGRG